MAELSRTHASNRTTAAIYVRVSTEEQATEGLSIPAQIETLTQYCQAYGIEIYKIYEDLGISGKDTIKRPALNRLIEASYHSHFNMVLVWKISRLSRSLKDLLFLIDLFDKNNIVFTSYTEKFDTSTPVGRMTLQLLGSIAEFERNTIVENVKLGLREYARQGGKTGSVLGYSSVEKRLVIEKKEAEAVRLIYELYTDCDMSFTEIAVFLNDKGYRTKRGRHFRGDSISRILGNPVYIGINRHNTKASLEEHTINGTHEPIIEQALWEAAQKKLGCSTGHKKRKMTATASLLQGFVKCPYCKGVMGNYYTLSNGRQYRYYRCTAHDRKGFYIASDSLESFVMEYISAILKYPDVLNDLSGYINRKYISGSSTCNNNRQFRANGNVLNKAREKRLSAMPKDMLSIDLSFVERFNNILGEIEKLEAELQSINAAEESTVYNVLPDIEELINRLINDMSIIEPKRLNRLIASIVERIEPSIDKDSYNIIFRFPVRLSEE